MVPEMIQFVDFVKEVIIPRRWLPFRTEWSIYDERRMIAGQIDSIWYDPSTKTFHMMDWKIIDKHLDPLDGQCFNKYGYGPCSSLLDNKFNHYACQQNLYAQILSECYDFHVESMSLVQFHHRRQSYTVMKLPRLYDLAQSMLNIKAFGSEKELWGSASKPKDGGGRGRGRGPALRQTIGKHPGDQHSSDLITTWSQTDSQATYTSSSSRSLPLPGSTHSHGEEFLLRV